jgi:NADH:ubiquinone oxidoreductase subunit 5 (subunit L)/multisubunit Na+/H+ antiporter MnhA subunit
VIDGGVNAAGFLTRHFSRLSIFWDTWVIDGLVRLSGLMVKLSSYPVRVLQTGSVQSYALMILAGVAIFLGWALTK